MEQDKRKSLRLEGYDYTCAASYFVTAVAFRREHLFGEIAAGKMAVNPLGMIVQEC